MCRLNPPGRRKLPTPPPWDFALQYRRWKGVTTSFERPHALHSHQISQLFKIPFKSHHYMTRSPICSRAQPPPMECNIDEVTMMDINIIECTHATNTTGHLSKYKKPARGTGYHMSTMSKLFTPDHPRLDRMDCCFIEHNSSFDWTHPEYFSGVITTKIASERAKLPVELTHYSFGYAHQFLMETYP